MLMKMTSITRQEQITFELIKRVMSQQEDNMDYVVTVVELSLVSGKEQTWTQC